MARVPSVTPVTDKPAEHKRELLRLLAKGDREIGRGKGHDLDAVLADADEQGWQRERRLPDGRT
jgi:hypothetical protein